MSAGERGAGWARRTAVVAALMLSAAACGSQASEDRQAEGEQRAEGGEVAASTSSTTTTAPPTPPPPPPPPPAVGTVPPAGLGPGDRGPLVAAAEARLAALHYDVGTVDDVFDSATGAGVTAFQKVQGLPRSGRLTQDAADALTTAAPPGPLVPGGGADRLEIDLPKQVLLVWKGDALARVLPVSTGSGQRFCDEGRCRVATTPVGSFRVGYRLKGWHESPLGRLYNPMYFVVGPGIAIHGYRTVPPQPASHGCVRIPMFAAETLPAQIPDGTPVYVIDGKTPVGPISPGGPQT